jgi:antibiotic biosynthesis monooxygenase (ABM) superfamily enzyme
MSQATVTEPLTAVVQRRIKAGSEARFEALMQEFVAFALRQPGHLQINVIRPYQGSRDYTVLDHFASEEARRRFTASAEYGEWMRQLREVSEGDPVIEELGGLAFWFSLPNRPPRRPPPRAKMALLTLLGVYPLSIVVPLLVIPATPGWPHWLQGLVIASVLVASLTWFVMPGMTRISEGWLFGSQERG